MVLPIWVAQLCLLRACVYSGSGLITVATHPNNHAALHSRCPEAMVIDINDTKMLTKMIEATDSILIGPGLGVDFKGNNAITFYYKIFNHIKILL